MNDIHAPDPKMPDRVPLPKRGRGRPTRNRMPYTPFEIKKLKEWHGNAQKTRGVSLEDSPERQYGNMFAAAIAEKRKEQPTGGQFTWKELGDPLGIAPRTLHAYLARRGYAPLKEGGTRPKYKGTSSNDRHRTEKFFPCGIHEITPENSYPPGRPGGPPRDKLCEKAGRKERYYRNEQERRKLARAQARVNQHNAGYQPDDDDQSDPQQTGEAA